MMQPVTFTEVLLDRVNRMRNNKEGIQCCRKIVAGGAYLLLPALSVVETVARAFFALSACPCSDLKSGQLAFSAVMASAAGSNSIICFFQNLSCQDQVTGW
jgi:hypothetical protein